MQLPPTQIVRAPPTTLLPPVIHKLPVPIANKTRNVRFNTDPEVPEEKPPIIAPPVQVSHVQVPHVQVPHIQVPHVQVPHVPKSIVLPPPRVAQIPFNFKPTYPISSLPEKIHTSNIIEEVPVEVPIVVETPLEVPVEVPIVVDKPLEVPVEVPIVVEPPIEVPVEVPIVVETPLEEEYSASSSEASIVPASPNIVAHVQVPIAEPISTNILGASIVLPHDETSDTASTSSSTTDDKLVPITTEINNNPLLNDNNKQQKEQSLEESSTSSSDSSSEMSDSEDAVTAPTTSAYTQMKEGIAKPFAKYFAELYWGGGFDQWHVVKFSTPADGSCLFHAIANSYFEAYHTELLRGKPITREKIVTGLRKELSNMLSQKVNEKDSASPRHYDILNHGNTAAFSKEVATYSLENMQKELDSLRYIGYGYMEFIGNVLEKDIYILDGYRCDIYITDELPLTIKGDRPSIVLCYMNNNHYELVGIENEDGTFATHFSPEHSFIRFLFQRVQELIAE